MKRVVLACVAMLGLAGAAEAQTWNLDNPTGNGPPAAPNQETPRTATCLTPSSMTPGAALVPCAGSGLTMNYTASSFASVNTTSATLFTQGAFTRLVMYCTAPGSTSNVWLNLGGGTAVVGSGLMIPHNYGCATFGTPALPLPSTSVSAITDGAAAQSMSYTGG